MADALLGGIVINEILADPNGSANFDTDGNGSAENTDEFIELYNASSATIDIGGLQLWDSGNGNWFSFPSPSILQPGAHAIVIAGVQTGGALPEGGPDDLAFDAGRGGPVINNPGDNVVLYDPASDTFISAAFNGDTLDDPTVSYSGFSSTATRIGDGENFGPDMDGRSIQRSPDGGDTFTNDQTPTPGDQNVCFTNGTLLETPDGPVPIEQLRPGDMLRTLENGDQKITWIWSKNWSFEALTSRPHLRPVQIEKGSLGEGLPKRDIRVSQQHRVLISSRIAERMFGQPEVLVPAKALIGLPGVEIALTPSPITYYHILLEAHEIILAEGLPAESLFLGPETIKAIDSAAIEELCEIFETDREKLGSLTPRPAKQFANVKRARQLVYRHCKNEKPLTSAL